MPPLARTLGVILVAAFPAGLAAQTYAPPTAERTAPDPVRFDRWNNQPAASFPSPDRSQHGAVIQTAAVAPVRENPPGQEYPEQTAAPEAQRAATPLPPRSEDSLRRLPPPGRSKSSQPEGSPGGGPSMLTVVGSLAAVLGLFLLVAYAMRHLTPRAMSNLPPDVFEVLGRAPLAGRQQVHLLRCGKKLLLVSVTATGTETLTEVTDPPEVDRLLGLCEQTKPNSATATFRTVFGQLAGDQSAPAPPPAHLSDLDDVRLTRLAAATADERLETRHA